MGCLPIIVLFLAGFGIGYVADGRAGAMWGAGIGLLVGLLAGIAVVLYLRWKHRTK